MSKTMSRPNSCRGEYRKLSNIPTLGVVNVEKLRYFLTLDTVVVENYATF